jgi:carboxylesterase type B
LNGAILAKATNAIVAVVQYRLGAVRCTNLNLLLNNDPGQLGFNSPDGRTNFAVQDVIASLKFLRTVLPSFAGDVSKITLAGQSSGANLIRALLATPSAAPLFQSAILHSDPMVSFCLLAKISLAEIPQDFGFQSPAVQSKLQQYFNEQISCVASDTSCLCSLPLSTVLSASDALYNNAMSIDLSATGDEPMRPVHDGVLITSTLDSSSPFPQVSKPIILSTVGNEAGPTIYGSMFPSPINVSTYETIVQSSFGESCASNLLAYPGYQVPNVTDGQPPDARIQLEQIGTDEIWRCPTWTFARSWTQNGGSAFVAHYTLGATYPDNKDVPYCSGAGVVCHEDDIEIVVRDLFDAP